MKGGILRSENEKEPAKLVELWSSGGPPDALPRPEKARTIFRKKRVN